MSWKRPIGWPNCVALVNVRDHQIEAGLHHADRARRQAPRARNRDPDIRTLTPLPSAPSTFSAGTSQSANTSSPVSEPRMPSLSSFGAVEKPLKPFSTINAVMPREPAVGIGLGVDHDRLGQRTVGDPHLRTVEHIAIAAPGGARAHRHDVRAGIRLRHGERADMLAGDQLGQIPFLLLGAAVAPDLIDAKIGMRAVGQPDRAEAREISSMATQWAR